MTTKFITSNLISIRPQSDAEKILMNNISAMLIAGKKPHVSFKENNFNGNDMILEIKSDKN